MRSFGEASKTEDKDEAILKSARWTARIQQIFLILKKQGDRMTNEQREALVAHWLEAELDHAEDVRTLHGHISDEYRENIYYPLSDQFDAVSEDLLTNNWRTIAQEADGLLKSAGFPPLDHSGVEFGRLWRRLLVAKQEYLRIEAERWNGEYATARGSYATPVFAPSDRKAATTLAEGPLKVTEAPLFSVVVDKYMAELPRADRSADRSRLNC